MQSKTIPLDCLIFGGGVAGLFTLDACIASEYRTLLLETNELGTGQTIDSQGIIHGGLKYAITGKSAKSALAIREMPLLWRRCLAGERKPDLTKVLVHSDYCHVWRTASLKSKLGWIAANMVLRVKPKVLAEEELPLLRTTRFPFAHRVITSTHRLRGSYPRDLQLGANGLGLLVATHKLERSL